MQQETRPLLSPTAAAGGDATYHVEVAHTHAPPRAAAAAAASTSYTASSHSRQRERAVMPGDVVSYRRDNCLCYCGTFGLCTLCLAVAAVAFVAAESWMRDATLDAPNTMLVGVGVALVLVATVLFAAGLTVCVCRGCCQC
mmetsp:Transcript_4559/g.11044  ORF Transcript_4559/g.11044 Transcript_4559/m.11044 type:complete len:141 (-) Transcript_4559:75-497(-)